MAGGDVTVGFLKRFTELLAGQDKWAVEITGGTISNVTLTDVDSLSIDGTLTVAGATTLTGTLAVNDDLTVTGNIIVSGTVDGRDVAADGAILDNLSGGDASGIQGHDEAEVTLNADISKLDITAVTYFIHGIKYTYAGGTAISPTIAGGDSSTWVGLDATGVVYSPTAYTHTDKHTILPLCRLQAVSGQSGSGSQLQVPIDLRYTIGEEGWVNRTWLEAVAGVLHPQDGNDGLINENATPLYIDQVAGTVYDAQRKDFEVTADTQLSGRAVYHVSGTWSLQADATIVTPLFYDDGTDIVALPVGKWAAHTLLRSPKSLDSFTLVYSQQQYNSQAEAEAAGADYGLYVSQSASTLYPVANLIVRGNSTSIESIVDLRPKMGANASSIIGTATLQQIYDNSTTPEINTDSTRGAFTVKENTADDTANVFEGKNNAGTTTFNVQGDGVVDMTSSVIDEVAAPSTPSTGKVKVYAKTDGLVYSLDDAGLETLMSGGSGGDVTWADYDGTADGSIDLALFTRASASIYGNRAARLSDTKAVFIWLDASQEKIFGRILTYNPTTKVLTAGAEQTIVTGGATAFNNNSSFLAQSIEVIDATNFVIGYREFNGAVNAATVGLCSVSGDTITLDNTAVYTTNSSDRIAISLIDSTKIFVAVCSSTVVRGNVASITVGSSISYNTWVSIEPTVSNAHNQPLVCKADSGGTCALVVYRDDTGAVSTNTLGVGITGTTVVGGTPQVIETTQGYSDNYGQILIRNVNSRLFSFLTNSIVDSDSLYNDAFIGQGMTETGGNTNAPTRTGEFIKSQNPTMNGCQVLEMANHDLIFHYVNSVAIQMTVTSKGYMPVPQHSEPVLSTDDTTSTPSVDFNASASACFVQFDDDAVAVIWGDTAANVGYKIIRKE